VTIIYYLTIWFILFMGFGRIFFIAVGKREGLLRILSVGMLVRIFLTSR